MFDARLRGMMDPPLNRLGAGLARMGLSADAVTLAGFVAGLAAAAAIIAGWFLAALLLIALNRVADGVDGALARATRKTDAGGFLDITLDFVVYGAIPAAFAVYDPAQNALAAALLLLAYYANGASFLAYAAIAAKRGEETAAQGEKSLFYMAGLAEGAETVAVMLLWCALPDWFAPIALLFASLVAASAAARILLAYRALKL